MTISIVFFINKFTTDKISSNSSFNVNEYVTMFYVSKRKWILYNNDNRKCFHNSINNPVLIQNVHIRQKDSAVNTNKI